MTQDIIVHNMTPPHMIQDTVLVASFGKQHSLRGKKQVALE